MQSRPPGKATQAKANDILSATKCRRPLLRPLRALRGGGEVKLIPVRPVTVQPGDTLWGLSVKHNTTVKELKNMNGWSQTENPTIYEGQTLYVPAPRVAPPSTRYEVVRDPIPPPPPTPVYNNPSPVANGCAMPPEGSLLTAQSDLWAYPGSKVVELSKSQIDVLLRASTYNPVAKDTFLIVYAPWCPYCKMLETTIEQLAQSLARDPSVQVARIRGDLPDLRSWSYQMLETKTFPTILALSRSNGNPVKHMGPRDMDTLLSFLNSSTGNYRSLAGEAYSSSIHAAPAAASPSGPSSAAAAMDRARAWTQALHTSMPTLELSTRPIESAIQLGQMTTGIVGFAVLVGATALALRSAFFALKRATIAAFLQAKLSVTAVGATASSFQQRAASRASTAFVESEEATSKREQLRGRLMDNHATLRDTAVLVGRLLVARLVLFGDQLVDTAGRLTRTTIGSAKMLGVILTAALMVPGRTIFALIEVAIAFGQGAVDRKYVPTSAASAVAVPSPKPPLEKASPAKRNSPIRARLEQMVISEEADAILASTKEKDPLPPTPSSPRQRIAGRNLLQEAQDLANKRTAAMLKAHEETAPPASNVIEGDMITRS